MVIPFNDYIDQIDVARRVEMLMVIYGFNVKSYQVDYKEIEKRTDAGISGSSTKGRPDGTDSLGADAKEVTIERYKAYQPVDVDLVFEVMSSGGWITVKIVQTKDKMVFGVLKAYESNIESEIERFLLQKNLIVEKAK